MGDARDVTFQAGVVGVADGPFQAGGDVPLQPAVDHPASLTTHLSGESVASTQPSLAGPSDPSPDPVHTATAYEFCIDAACDQHVRREFATVEAKATTAVQEAETRVEVLIADLSSSVTTLEQDVQTKVSSSDLALEMNKLNASILDLQKQLRDSRTQSTEALETAVTALQDDVANSRVQTVEDFKDELPRHALI
jgi:hypothetical protein